MVGIDTYHDSAKKGRSVGGIVCSLNRNLTRYYSACTFQMQTQELVDGACIRLRGKKAVAYFVKNYRHDITEIFESGIRHHQTNNIFCNLF